MVIKIERLTPENLDENLGRPVAGADPAVLAAVQTIITDVAKRGDTALLEYTAKFDGVRLRADQLRVEQLERDRALAEVPGNVIDSLKLAAERVRAFHRRQLPDSWTFKEEGVLLGQRVTAIGRAGLYVPGGLADYPSSVIMNVVPAQIAGVSEIALCVPPDREGRVSKYVLAAAALLGVDEIYRVGGAQAIAAMAYGTESIKTVDKITGPGNIYVATAKKLVVGAVDIDMVAGPTEVVVVADRWARADFIAADLIAQAEHDTMASSILITDDEPLARAVDAAVESQLATAARADIAAQSLAERGRAYIVEDLELAVDFINRFAPEHLEIMTAEPQALARRVKNAGAIFLGEYTPEALGDYVAGSNHVLPTGSTARFYSPLGVHDFIKWTSVLSFSKEALAKIGSEAVVLAGVEGLDGHGRSVQIRLDSLEPGGDRLKND